jgi:hypothetical protein
MEINILNLRKSINKAYLKVKPNRTQIETFKKNITNLFDQIKESESEEFHKNIISEFLKNTYYSPNNYINTKGRSDLVIHNGKDSNSTVGVLFEVKKPGNKSEMPTCKDINTKAFHELILYYLRERITNKNIEIKYLVITNIFEWFIFNANDFEKLFSTDKNLVKQFIDFEEGRLSGTNTDFFYKSIAEPFCNELDSPISLTHFNISDFETTVKNARREDDTKLIALYKIFSPEHLLKLPFANDSNNLDKTFYNELLHIIGLEETKEGGKKLIGRNAENKRNQGSLIENSITILKYEDCLTLLPKLSDYGSYKEEQLFNIALELVITWINRILFLKLLEGQLIKYNNGDKSFRFLNIEKIHDYDELNKLFFQVLAVKESDRSEVVKQKFGNVPYLNSSLFEPSDLEHKTIRISSLENHTKHPVLTGTVLKDKTGKKLAGKIDPLQYLFDFLDSYDFSSEGSEDIQEENKTLINASVLGLIFEKINGYKDGSFFTPGFITMYMCHETIRRAVVQKFNDAKDWKCETINDVYNKIEDIKEANWIVNSLRICDPAVGSGHFLVSALNEIISIKSELKILTDKEGKRLKDYTVEVINDELVITDTDDKFFEYNPKDKDSQRIQETLFKEKQTIIENCLFGVDINPNSVKICRLRLWIELLKNSYYKPDRNYRELETLPNIDINIKCGNSLISRYSLDANIKTALKSSKWNVDNYREAVMTYRNAQSKDEKRNMEQLISKIKNDFETEVSKSDKRFLKLNKLNGELLSLTNQSSLFELTKTQKEEWNKKVKKLTEEAKKYETEIAEIKSNKIYENAFEWRFEFPEVLNSEGDFVGFDVVIGNPPYIRVQELDYKAIDFYKTRFKVAFKRIDISIIFIELSKEILGYKGFATYITSNQFLTTEYGLEIRKFLKNEYRLVEIIDYGDLPVFEEALTYVSIFSFCNDDPKDFYYYKVQNLKDVNLLNRYPTELIDLSQIQYDNWTLSSNKGISIINKLKKYETLNTIGKSWAGLFTGKDDLLMFDEKEIENFGFEENSILPVIRASDCDKYAIKKPSKYVIYPYKFEKNQTLLLEEDEFMSLYPKTYQYVLSKKSELSNRKDSRRFITNQKGWYKLTRFGQKNVFNEIKIVSPGEVKNHKFCIDYSKSGFSCARVFAITLIDKELDLRYLLSLLNSNLIKYYLQSMASLKAGGYYTYSSNILNKVPIIRIGLNNQAPFINLVDEILNAKKINPSAITSTLEAKIDFLFYELYGLTDEEIRIVEN